MKTVGIMILKYWESDWSIGTLRVEETTQGDEELQISPHVLGAWRTQPDQKEQDQTYSHGSQEHGINSTLPPLSSLMDGF